MLQTCFDLFIIKKSEKHVRLINSNMGRIYTSIVFLALLDRPETLSTFLLLKITAEPLLKATSLQPSVYDP